MHLITTSTTSCKITEGKKKKKKKKRKERKKENEDEDKHVMNLA